MMSIPSIVLRAAVLVVLLTTAGSAGPRPRAGTPDPGAHPGRLKHYDRWKEMERKGQLTPALRARLRAEDIRTGRRVREHARGVGGMAVRRRPDIIRPEGVPPPPPAIIDTVLSQWVAHYSSGIAPSTDGAAAVTYDAAGNVVVVGYTTGIFSGNDFVTAKYNSAGVLEWVATYNGPGNDYDGATAVALDAAGNVYVTGSSFGVDSEEDYATIKYTAAGQELWVARYDGTANDYDAAVGIKLDVAGNAHVTGVSYGLTSDGDYVTVKYSTAGQQLWVARYNDTGNDFDAPVGLGIDLSGSVYVSGTAYGFDTYEDYVTVKYSFQGDQVWVARYDGPGMDYDAVSAITVDISGNSYITGTSYNANFDADYATVKYDAFGRRDWLARFNTPDEVDEVALAIAIDPSRNVYVTGTSFAFGSGEDFLTIKYSSTGSERWTARYNGTGNGYDEGRAIAVDAGGNVYVTGSSIGLDGTEDIATVKYTTLGVAVWAMRYTGIDADYDAGSTIAVDGSGNVYAAGVSYGPVTDEDLAVLKYSPTGGQLWAVRYNGPGNSADEAIAVALDGGGNIIVTGTSYDIISQSDYATVKYSPAGTELWEVRYNGTGDGEDFASALAVDIAGNVFVTGTSLGAVSGYDIATVKYNTNGVEQWVARHTTAGNAIDEGVDVATDGAGNVYVTGTQYDPATGTNIVTLKYQTTGTPVWTGTYDGTGAGLDRAYDLAVDAGGVVVVTGASAGAGTLDDIVTMKYTTAGSRQWAVRYNGAAGGDDRGYAVAFESNNVVVAGMTAGSGTGTDGVLLRYTTSGTLLWTRTYNSGGADNDLFTALAVGPLGGIYGAGTARSTTPGYDCLLVKYSTAGALQWAQRYNSGENDDDVTMALTLDIAENIYVTAYSFLLLPGYDYLTLKYAPDGTQLWATRYDNPSQYNDEPRGVAVDRDGNVYVAGYSETEDGSVYSLVKYEAPRFAPARSSLVFPSTVVGCRSTDTVIVRNPTSANKLVVSGVVSNSTAFTATPTSFHVPPGDSLRLIIRFAPTLAGSSSGAIILTHNGITTPDSILVSGVGTGSGAAVLVTATPGAGWQLYALPVNVSCPVVIPFSYGFNGAYFRSDTITTGRGYWSKLADSVLQFTGFPMFADTVPVNAGWNLVGSLSVPVRVSGIRSTPDSIVRTAFYGYAGSYYAADSLRPVSGYWVKVSQSGVLFVGPPTAAAAGVSLPEGMARLRIRDAVGNEQTLLLSPRALADAELETYELPPPPPSDAFDARFVSGRMVEDVRAISGKGLGILLQSASFPVTLEWEPGRETVTGELRSGRDRTRLEHRGTIEVPSAGSPILLTAEGTEPAVPLATGLAQNTPNPFNPSTVIEYTLQEQGRVELRVFDMLGRPVATLVEDVREAGTHRADWNAGALASGVYLYRLSVVPVEGSGRVFRQTRKMLLLK